jgi:hypothetical protein
VAFAQMTSSKFEDSVDGCGGGLGRRDQRLFFYYHGLDDIERIPG